MNAWLNIQAGSMANVLAEDVGAPELRNPKNSAIHARGWLARLFKKSR